MHGGKYLKAEIVRKKGGRNYSVPHNTFFRKLYRCQDFELDCFIAGKNLVSDPIFNKGLAFPYSERDRLAIRGLVPPTL
jgi:hypothetical protein